MRRQSRSGLEWPSWTPDSRPGSSVEVWEWVATPFPPLSVAHPHPLPPWGQTHVRKSCLPRSLEVSWQNNCKHAAQLRLCKHFLNRCFAVLHLKLLSFSILKPFLNQSETFCRQKNNSYHQIESHIMIIVVFSGRHDAALLHLVLLTPLFWLGVQAN